MATSRAVGVAVGALAGVLAVGSYVELTDNTGRISRAFGHSPLFRHDNAFGLAMAMTTAVAYALILVLVGRSLGRRSAAALLALAAGFSRWLLLVVTIRDYYPEQHYPMATNYASLMVPVTFATLAWGAARRHGSRWLLAVLIAPLLMCLQVWLWFHNRWYRDFQGSHGMTLIFALYLGPIVIACLVGWLLDDRPGRSTPAPDQARGRLPTPA